MRLDPISVINHTRVITREWIQYLTPSEFMVVMFIFDRTVGWCKGVERIPMSHFLKGVHRGAKTYHCGLSLSEQTIRRSLVSLVTKGALACTTLNGRPKQYGINFYWKTDMPLAISRKRKAEKEGLIVQTPYQFGTPKKRIKSNSSYDEPNGAGARVNKDSDDEETVVHHGSRTRELASRLAAKRDLPEEETTWGAVNLAIARNKKARAKHVVKAEKKPSGAQTMFTLWRAYCRMFHQGVTVLPWRVDEKGMANTLRKKCLEGGMTPKAFNELLKWAIENWESIIAARFAWMTKPQAPQVPTLKFFVRWIGDFVTMKESGIRQPRERTRSEEGPKRDSVRILGSKRKELQQLEKEIEKKKQQLRTIEDVHHGSQEAKQTRLARFRTVPEARTIAPKQSSNKPWLNHKHQTFQWQDKD